MVKLICMLLVLLNFMVGNEALANSQHVTLAMMQMSLPDAVRLLANYLHINVMISQSVKGTATFNLENTAPEAALDLLLAAHGLARWQLGDVWLVGSQDDLLKRKQQEVKLQLLEEASIPLVMHVWQLQYASATSVSELISGGSLSLVSKRGHMRADDRTNQLYVEDTPDSIRQITALIKRMDIPAQQIAVDARIVSIDVDAQRELGFDFALNPEGKRGRTPGTALKKLGRYSMAIARLADGSLLDVKLAALENAGHAELISSPSLYAANQQTASIEAGEEVPYQEVSESGGTAIAFKKAVLGLKLTPQILPGNKVLLHLQINQDRPDARLVMSMPTISTRQIVTSVLAKSGQTIVLGGIYENSATAGEDRLPYLSDVPLLGWLFKLQKNRMSRRELLIFVTPTIVDHAL